MIQKFSVVRVIDNSGSKKAKCIHLYKGFRRRYAKIGDMIKVTLLNAKVKKHKKIKLKKGQLIKAVVVQTKYGRKDYSGNSHSFKENGIALISERKKFIGTKLYVPVLRSFRSTKYARLTNIGRSILK